MPTFQIELDDKGKPAGELPEAVQKFIDGKFNEGFGKGAEKTAKEAKAQVDQALAEAKGSTDPLVREKIATLEKEAARLNGEIAKRDGDWQGQIEAEKKAAKLEIKAREETIAALKADNEKRTARLKELAANEIKAAALKNGALEGAVDDLAALLSPQIGLDESLQWFVLDADGKSARLGEDGKPVSVEGLVAKTLAEKPYFKAAGGSRAASQGGRSLSTGTGVNGNKVEQAEAFAMANPNDRAAVTNVVSAIVERARTRH